MKNIRLILSCISLLLSISLYAQDPVYRNYTTSDGLTSTNVYYVMQDTKGFIWFATDNGVSRFDGTNFKNYSIANGLSDNSVLKIVEDSENRLWFLTFNGKLSFYDYKDNKIYNSSNSALLKKLNFTSFITYFFQDSKKNIWVATIDNSLTRIADNNSVTTYNCPGKSLRIWEDRKGVVRNLSFSGIYILSDTGLTLTPVKYNYQGGINLPGDTSVLVVSTQGLSTISMEGKLKYIDSLRKYNLSSVIGFSLEGNNVWMETLSGVVEFEDGIISPYKEKDFFKKFQITTVFKDKDNNYWFTSVGAGVFVVPSLHNSFFDESKGLVESNVLTFEILNNNQIMVGLNNGDVQIIDRGEVKKYGQSLISPNGSVLKIIKDNNNVWILTEHTLFKYNGGKFVIIQDSDEWNKSLFIANDNVPWIGKGRGLKKVIGNHMVLVDNTKTNRVYSILQLHTNEFLLGTDLGLYHFSNGKIYTDKNRDTLLTHRINSMVFGADSSIWIGTNGYGLLNLYHNQIKSYTIKDHMISDRCNDLFVDGNKLYVATDNGLNVITKGNDVVNINSYSVANGLISNHINQVAKKDKSTLILATDRGLVEVDIPKLFTPSICIPYLNSLTINDSLQSILNNYNLNYNENNIQIDFGAINFNSGGIIQYRYKLVGADADWNYTTYTSVKYSYLHSGSYKFIVATQDADGSWNPKTASFSFYIKTPWWQTWWFRTGMDAGLIAVIYLIIRWRVKVYKHKINRERALAESELKALRAQINPHFIYNSLNAIQDFILQNQKEDANFYLTKFATLMRRILTHSRTSYISLEEEIAYLQLYLELEALRFNNKFIFKFIISNNIDIENVNIPSMILQPYIENAVLHGVAGLDGEGLITINFNLEDKFLVCVIEDNGIGRKRATELKNQRVWKGHKSLGMTVTQERIDLLSNYQKQKINVEITDIANDKNKDCGTRVAIYFSLVQ